MAGIKSHRTILIVASACFGSIAHALRKIEDDVVVIRIDDVKTEPTETSLPSPPINIFAESPLPDINVITKPTKPIDAIASRHKYPRKKNEW
jgi:hypothetical protein